MSSMSGYISYLKYTIGQEKGAMKNGEVLRDAFHEQRGPQSEYTSAKVTQNFVDPKVKSFANFKDFAPIYETITLTRTEVTPADEEAGTEEKSEVVTYRAKDVVVNKDNGTVTVNLTAAPVAMEVDRGGNVDRVFAEGNYKTTALTITTTGENAGAIAEVVVGDKITYVYNNIVVPQAALPTVRAEMEAMPLLAKARRIAVFYSQIAAFQAKTDYGFDLGDQLAEQAVGQLAYEIDTEIVEMLYKNADQKDELCGWSTVLPVGVNKRDHYEGFAEVVEVANQIIYDRTKKFAATYMVCASNVLRILTFIPGFNAAPKGKINGPYFAGTLNGLKVFVSPALAAGDFFFGVNGDDMMSSAAVYAPYMPVVPTQLLQYADGGTSQGWSTLYDLKMLNKLLLVGGRIDDQGMNWNLGTTEYPVVHQAKANA